MITATEIPFSNWEQYQDFHTEYSNVINEYNNNLNRKINFGLTTPGHTVVRLELDEDILDIHRKMMIDTFNLIFSRK